MASEPRSLYGCPRCGLLAYIADPRPVCFCIPYTPMRDMVFGPSGRRHPLDPVAMDLIVDRAKGGADGK